MLELKLKIERYIIRKFHFSIKKSGKEIPPGEVIVENRIGSDAGRHKKYAFADGPVHQGSSSQTANWTITDLMIVRVLDTSGNVLWEEPSPNSDRNTRVLSILVKDESSDEMNHYVQHIQFEMNDIEKETFVLGDHTVHLRFPVYR